MSSNFLTSPDLRKNIPVCVVTVAYVLRDLSGGIIKKMKLNPSGLPVTREGVVVGVSTSEGGAGGRGGGAEVPPWDMLAVTRDPLTSDPA